MDGSGGEPEAASGSGFEWDADSQLYYHASTGFYHDPVAGWYYSSRDGQYYIYENGNYMPWTPDEGNEPKTHCPRDEYNQGLEPDIPNDQDETWRPPSEWMEETLINMYLSGYSNAGVNAKNSIGNSETNVEDSSETTEKKLGMFAVENAPSSLYDATLDQIEDETQTECSTAVDESLREEEEKWLAQYGQVERANGDQPLYSSIDLWDWDMVMEPVSKGQPLARLVGRLVRGSSKLHPSLPARGGFLKTSHVRQVHLDLVRVSSGKLYRLRNPGRKFLASLSSYDSSNPTKDWGFPEICANINDSLRKQSTAQCHSEVADDEYSPWGVSAATGKEHKMNTYRDRAAERRILHRGLGIGPGQKQSSDIDSDEYVETSEGMNLAAASVDMNFCSSGLNSAKRIMENMGWKQGEALGKSSNGIVEPIQLAVNKHGAGLGWNQTRQDVSIQ